MAVYQGARVRAVSLSGGEESVSARSAAPPSERPRGRVRPAGLVMALIVSATMLGLVYLTQTLGSNATSSEIRGYATEQASLDKSLKNHANSIEVNTDPSELIERAKALKLKKVGKTIVLDAP